MVVVITMSQPYHAGEKPPVVLAMHGHQTKTKQEGGSNNSYNKR